MPRDFFHLHAGQSRANPVQTGQRLPSPEAALEAAERIAHQLLAWNFEPEPWRDYHVQVTNEADTVLFELPLSGVGDVQAAPS